jgi:hypothetical protein
MTREGDSQDLLWSTGQCLWSTYMRGSDVVVAPESKNDDILDGALKLHDITDAVSAEKLLVSTTVIEAVKESLRNRPPPPATNSHISDARSIWTYTQSLNSSVSDEEVKLLQLGGVRTELIVALNVLVHTMRMTILQNYSSPLWANGISSVWYKIVTKLGATSKKALSRSAIESVVKGYSSDNDIIRLMKEMPRSLDCDSLDANFVQEASIAISNSDTTEDIGHKLCSELHFNVSTGLYLFRIQFDAVDKTPGNITYIPLLVRKDEQCYHSAACIYMNEESILFKLITRSLMDVNANQYIYCTFIWNRKTEKWLNEKRSKPNWTSLPKEGNVFPCNVDKYFLYAIVIIPTRSQLISGTFSMFLRNASEPIAQDWVVSDQLSLNDDRLTVREAGVSNHLRAKVLRSMFSDLMRHGGYTTSKQSFFLLEADFIQVLHSYMEYLNNLPSIESVASVFPPSDVLQFERTCARGTSDILHLIVSYEDVNNQQFWVYMYLLKTESKLVILTRRCDHVREILKICSSIKFFLDIILPSPISIQQLLWRDRKLCQGNSGYYAVKQFWKNAGSIHCLFKKMKGAAGDYLRMITKLDDDLKEAEDEDDVITPSWILKEITVKQVKQLKESVGNKIFRQQIPNQGFYIPDFLLND